MHIFNISSTTVQSLYNVEIHLLKVHVTQPRYLLSVLDRCMEKEVPRPAIRAGDADINAFFQALMTFLLFWLSFM